MYEQFPFPGCRVEQVTRVGPERVGFALQATGPQAFCAICLTPSTAVHSWYRRHPADLPNLGQAGVTCGGEAGARLLQGLAMPTSADTVLRLVRALPLPDAEAPRALGVDDWALKKGQTYGTTLVDLETRRVAAGARFGGGHCPGPLQRVCPGRRVGGP